MNTPSFSTLLAAQAPVSKPLSDSAQAALSALTSSSSTSRTPTSDAPRLEILQTAISLTSSDRNETYGDCLTNHQAFGELLSWYAKWAGKLDVKSEAHDAAIMQALTKIARIAVGRFHRDNYIDGAAYLAIAFECEARERNPPPGQHPLDR
jgi:hypothetical protein